MMMKRWILIWMSAFLIAVPALAQQTKPSPATGEPKTDKEKLSYSLGANLARNLQVQKFDLDFDMVVRGLKDGMTGNLVMKQEDMQATVSAFYTAERQKKMEEQKVLGETNKKAGAAFLETNAKKSGVVALPSGVQYRVLTAGTGPKPKATDRVRVNYVGKTIDGAEFDNSARHNQAAVFPVTGVIKGWTEVLQLMPVGSKWEVVIPPELGYGMRSIGEKVGPNSTLVFEIELLSIEAGTPQTKP